MATLPLSGRARSAPRQGPALPFFCFVPRDEQRGSALRAIAGCSPALRLSRSARRRFASGSPHARLRSDARLLPRQECIRRTPRLAILRMASPARARRYAASLFLPAIVPPARPCVSRFTARRYRAFVVRALSQNRDVRILGAVLRTVAECPQPVPVAKGESAGHGSPCCGRHRHAAPGASRRRSLPHRRPT